MTKSDPRARETRIAPCLRATSRPTRRRAPASRACGPTRGVRCPTTGPGADVAILGVPFDSAVSFRPGARYGPAAVREMSLMMRRWHPALEVDVFDALSVIDGGDITTTPGNAERTAGQIAEALAPVLAGGRRAAGPRRGSLDRAGRAARPRRPARPRRRRAARRSRRHLGLLLGRALHPRDAVSPRAGRGPHRPTPLAAGGDARVALRRGGLRGAARVGLCHRPVRGAADLDAGALRRRGDPPAGRWSRLHVVRRRRARPGVRARDGHAGDRRAAAPRGAGLPARAGRAASSSATTSSRCRPPTTGLAR